MFIYWMIISMCIVHNIIISNLWKSLINNVLIKSSSTVKTLDSYRVVCSIIDLCLNKSTIVYNYYTYYYNYLII